MEYKVIKVNSIDEIQETCQAMSSKGFILITVFPEDLKQKNCCETIIYRGAVMVFARNNE